jgi:hypothetical protein
MVKIENGFYMLLPRQSKYYYPQWHNKPQTSPISLVFLPEPLLS